MDQNVKLAMLVLFSPLLYVTLQHETPEETDGIELLQRRAPSRSSFSDADFILNSLLSKERRSLHYEASEKLEVKWKRWCLLQLILLNEATLVLVNDGEGLLDVIGGLGSQADLSKELLVLERVGSFEETEKGSY